jgi:hypothetical protein
MKRTVSKYLQARLDRKLPIETPADPTPAAPTPAAPAAPAAAAELVASSVPGVLVAAPAADSSPVLLVFKNSSNLRSAQLDVASGIVEVEFANGTRYRFANFTSELMDGWKAAQSAGGWFHQHVKRNPDLYPVVGGMTVER